MFIYSGFVTTPKRGPMGGCFGTYSIGEDQEIYRICADIFCQTFSVFVGLFLKAGSFQPRAITVTGESFYKRLLKVFLEPRICFRHTALCTSMSCSV